MSTTPRRSAPASLIRRRYEPSRIQRDSLISAYAIVIPVVSRLAPPTRRLGEPDGARAQGGNLRPSAAGA
jgi:hypothetical protein